MLFVRSVHSMPRVAMRLVALGGLLAVVALALSATSSVAADGGSATGEATMSLPGEAAQSSSTLRFRGQLSSDGEPAPAARVAVRRSGGWEAAETDDDGAFQLMVRVDQLPEVGADGGPVRLRVTAQPGAYSLDVAVASNRGLTRLAGRTRWETMSAIAGWLDAPGDAAYVGSGMSYADALSAGPLAAREGAPVLLTPPERVLSQVTEPAAAADEVTVIGGEDAVGAPVARALTGEGRRVERIGGATRWATSAMVARQWQPDEVDVAYVASGDGAFADALSGGAAAAADRAPLLLVAREQVPDDVAAALDHLQPEEIVLLGGDAAVSPAVERRLADIASVERIAGSDRYATSAAIASSRFDPAATDAAVLATGGGFADALAGVSPAAQADAPLLLVDESHIPAPVATTLQSLRIDDALLLGGSDAISSSVETAVGDLLTSNEWTRIAEETLQVPVEADEETEPAEEPAGDGGGDGSDDSDGLPAGGAQTQAVSSVSQHGVTVSFDGEYEAGRFVTGDWFVVGEPTVTGLSPGWDGTRNGAMVDPQSGSSQGYHTGIDGYDASLNVAASLPQQLQPGESLVATTGWVQSDPGAPEGSHPDESLPRPALRDAMVVTVVDDAPPAGSFRPPYSAGPKELHSVESLRWDRLSDLSPVAGTPSWDELAGRVARPWIDHKPSYSGYYLHPSENMPDYGREIAASYNEVTLGLLQAGSQADKRPALIGAVQVGIDLHGSLRNAATTHDTWAGGYGGGIGSGRKWPVLFAGLMLDDPTLAAVGQDYPRSFFAEDCYTFYSGDRAQWSDGNCIDGSTQDSAYRTCCTANAWNGAALAARLMGAVEQWNHDPFFDYVDWHMANETGWQRAWTTFLGNAWDTHR